MRSCGSPLFCLVEKKKRTDLYLPAKGLPGPDERGRLPLRQDARAGGALRELLGCPFVGHFLGFLFVPRKNMVFNRKTMVFNKKTVVFNRK